MSTGEPADPAARRYPGTPDDGPEIELPRGDVTEGVVRVGGTVRRPHQPQSLAVAAYLDHLEGVGFEGSPRYLGRDDAGRDVLTFVEGDVPGDPPEPWAADEGLLASVGALVRRLHEASAGFLAGSGFAAPAGSVWGRDLVPATPTPVREQEPEQVPDQAPELITHCDVTPQNVVVRDGRAVGLVDFDLAGPATRLLDVYNTAMHWVPLRDPADVWATWRGVDQAARLRVLADGYGLDAVDREAIVDLGIRRAAITWQRMKAAAEHLGGGWARMWADGVGDQIRRREAWLTAHRDELTKALR
jgi:hypothetical protein